MIIKTKEFQDSSRKISEAVDNSSNGVVDKIGSSDISYSEILELIVNNGILTLKVSNGEYYVMVSNKVDTDESFRVTIQANKFLKLISKVTTETVELSINDSNLVVKANGIYKFPLICDVNGDLIGVKKIDINNVTNEFDISNENLQNIYKYNSKILQMSGIRKPIHRMFYIDDKGAITATGTTACINNFSLSNQIKVLLNEKLVKLFRLLNEDSVHFSMGFDMKVNSSVIQTKVKFITSDVEIVSIVNNETELLNSLRVDTIRNLATTNELKTSILDKGAIIESLDRLNLFSKDEFTTCYTFLHFDSTGVTIYDTKKVNYEKINYVENYNVDNEEYDCIINTNDIRLTLESINESHIVLKYGNHSNIIVSRPNYNVTNVIVECHLNN